MTNPSDSQMLDWIEKNVQTIREHRLDKIEVTYIAPNGMPVRLEGDNLRDAVRKALAHGN